MTVAPFQFGGNMPMPASTLAPKQESAVPATVQTAKPMKKPMTFPWLNSQKQRPTNVSLVQKPTTGVGVTVPPWFLTWNQGPKTNSLMRQNHVLPSKPNNYLPPKLPFPQTVANQWPAVKLAQAPPTQPFWWLPHHSPQHAASMAGPVRGSSAPVQAIGRSAASLRTPTFSPNECVTGNDLHQVLRDPGGWANICPEMRIRCSGLLVEWRFRSSVADHTSVYLSVWRENKQGTYSLVGSSEVMATSRGKQTFRPMHPITVRKGDFLGVYYRDPSRPGVVPYLDSKVAGVLPSNAKRMDTCYSFFIGSNELAGDEGVHQSLEASRGVKVHRLYDLQAVISPLPDVVPGQGEVKANEPEAMKQAKLDEAKEKLEQDVNPRAAGWGKMTLNSALEVGNKVKVNGTIRMTTWSPMTMKPVDIDPWTQKPNLPPTTRQPRRNMADEWLSMIQAPDTGATDLPVWARKNSRTPMGKTAVPNDAVQLPLWEGNRNFNKTSGSARPLQAPPTNSPLYNIWVNEYSWGRNQNQPPVRRPAIEYARSPCGTPPTLKAAFATDISAERATYKCYPGYQQVSGNGISRCDIPARKWSTPNLICMLQPAQGYQHHSQYHQNSHQAITPSSSLEVVELRIQPRNKQQSINDTTSKGTTSISQTATESPEACQREYSCGDTPEVENSMAELSYKRPYGCEGDSVRYSCLPGFKFAGQQSDVIVCRNLKWTPNEFPSCIAV